MCAEKQPECFRAQPNVRRLVTKKEGSPAAAARARRRASHCKSGACIAASLHEQGHQLAIIIILITMMSNAVSTDNDGHDGDDNDDSLISASMHLLKELIGISYNHPLQAHPKLNSHLI